MKSAVMKREDSRGKNFLESERILLIKLCNKYKKIIECKRSDMNFLKDKEAAWQQITRQFNAVFVGAAARTTKQLQEKYKNIKKILRKQHSESKKYITGTGGGPYISPPDTKTEVEKELFETIRLSADGLANEFDTDGRYKITGAPPQTITIDKKNNNLVSYDSVPDDWTSGSSLLWRAPKNPKLSVKLCLISSNKNLGKQTEEEVPSHFSDLELFMNSSENTEQVQEIQSQRKQTEKKNLEKNITRMNTTMTNPDKEASSFADFDLGYDFYSLDNVEQEYESQTQDLDENHNSSDNEKLRGSKENKDPIYSRYEYEDCPFNSTFFISEIILVGAANRRRPILKRKRKTVTSAGSQFELAAQKKISLIEHEMLVSTTKLKQIQEEHKLKMEILKVRKNNETIKQEILKEGKMKFEF